MQPLEEEYPYRLEYPLGNTYGMMLYSRLPLRGEEIRFLVQDDVPSVYAQVELPSGALLTSTGSTRARPSPALTPMSGTRRYSS